MSTSQTTLKPEDRAQLLAYVRQQADSGAYAALLSKVLVANASNTARIKDRKAPDPYKLSPFQREVLTMIYELGSVGCGAGMGYALERLHGLKLIEKMTNGFYRLTEKGRWFIQGQAVTS